MTDRDKSLWINVVCK